MKNNYSYIFLLAVFTLTTAGKCRKENEEPKLPPETTIGAMTFGCKVNGKVFVPKDGRGKPGLYAQYVYLGSGARGGWFLGLNANNWKEEDIPTVRITTDSLLLTEGSTYSLKPLKGFPTAGYDVGSSFYSITNADSGKLTITKHHSSKRILSGSFWFDATNPQGQKIEVREGRFDIVY